MSAGVLTKDDLRQLGYEILEVIREHIESRPDESKKWVKASEVKARLGISGSTLAMLRKDGTLKYWTDDVMILYDYEHIKGLLEKGARPLDKVRKVKVSK